MRRLIALLASLLVWTPALGQQSLERVAGVRSRQFDWLRIPKPSEHDVVGFTQGPGGRLFVADKFSVSVREADGWRKIWQADPERDGTVACLGALDGLPGLSEVALVVETDNRRFVLAGERAVDPVRPWSVFRLRYTEKALSRPEKEVADHPVVRVVSHSSQQGLVGFAVDADGGIAPIRLEDGFTIGAREQLVGSSSASVLWAPGLGGTSFAWKYRGSRISVLDPGGRREKSIDVEKALGRSAEEVHVRAVCVDSAREMWFVGTNRGVLVGRLGDSGSPAGPLHPVKAYRGVEVTELGFSAGRLVVVAADASPVGLLTWERTLESCSGRVTTPDRLAMNLRPSGGLKSGSGPRRASSALQPAEDLWWVQDETGRLWEWSPSGWQRLLEESTDLAENLLDLDVSPVRPWQPVVLTNLLDSELLVCRPRTLDDWTFHRAQAAWLVPDPSGTGFWAVERAPAGISGSGYVRFVTEHGIVDTADEISYGKQRLRVAHWRLFDCRGELGGADNTAHPITSDDTVLLPFGDAWLEGRGGDWRLHSLVGSSIFEQLVPTPGIANGWTGLAREPGASAPHALVQIDVLDGKLVIETVAKCSAEAVTLALGPEPELWLGERVSGEWVLQRVGYSKLEGERVRPRPSKEPPRFYAPGREMFEAGSVITDHGAAATDRDWRELLDSKSSAGLDSRFGTWMSAPLRRGSLPGLDPGAQFVAVERRLAGLGGPVVSRRTWLFKRSVSGYGFQSLPGPTGRQAPILGCWPSVGLAVWGMDDSRDRVTQSPILEWYRGAKPPESRSQIVPSLVGALDAAILTSGPQADGSAPTLAVSDGSRIAIHAPWTDRVDNGAYWPHLAAIFVEQGNDSQVQLEPWQLSSTTEFAATATRLHFKFAPGPEHWWWPECGAANLYEKGSQRSFQANPDGSLAVDLSPDTELRFALIGAGPWASDRTVLAPEIAFAVRSAPRAEEPPLDRSRFWPVVLFLLTAAAALATLSIRERRRRGRHRATPMLDDYRVDLFMSYSRKDLGAVRELVKSLEEKERAVFLDKRDIPGGSDWNRWIDDAIKRCHALVVVLSPDSVASEEVGNEIRMADSLSKPVIPVRLRECELPRMLLSRQFVDALGGALNDAEVVAAILRAVPDDGHRRDG